MPLGTIDPLPALRLINGDLILQNFNQDKDLILRVDDGGVLKDPLIIDGSEGNVHIGGQIHPLTTAYGPLFISREGDTTLVGIGCAVDVVAAPIVAFMRSRGTISSPTLVQNGDLLGEVQFYGQYDSTIGHVSVGAQVVAYVTPNNWGVGDTPAGLRFYTTPSGSSTSLIRMTISHDGKVSIGTTDATAIEILSVGNATRGIDFSSSGLSGSTDYPIYLDVNNHWAADGRWKGHIRWNLIHSGTNASPEAYIEAYNDQWNYAPLLIFRKSHHDSEGVMSPTINTEVLGQIIFYGVDSGSNFDGGAIIRAVQDGAASTTVPTKLAFYTSDGTNPFALRMEIGKDGQTDIWSDNYAPLRCTRSNRTADTISAGVTILAQKQTNMGNGFGSCIAFEIQDDTAGPNIIALIGATWSGGDNHGQIEFWPYLSGIGYSRGSISPNGTWTIGPTNNVTGLKFLSLGNATRAIDLSDCGLSGDTDYYVYIGANAYWRGDDLLYSYYVNSYQSSIDAIFNSVHFAKTHGDTLSLYGRDTDGASAVGVKIDNDNTLSTAGAKILSIRNNNVEKAYVDKDGSWIGHVKGEIIHSGANNCAISYQTTYHDDLNSYCSEIILRKSHNDTEGSMTTTVNSEELGAVGFMGIGTNSNFGYGARILGQQSGSADVVGVPTQILFQTWTTTLGLLTKVWISEYGTLSLKTYGGQTALYFYDLGTATKAIDISNSGLSGTGDYWIYSSATDYWRADGSMVTNYLQANIGTISPYYWAAYNAGLSLRGREEDDASAVALKVICETALTTAGAKLLSLYSDNGTTEKAYIDIYGAYQATSSVYWHCKYLDPYSISAGGSGATLVTADANTLGGYNLDDDTEYLYFHAKICNDWDASTDLKVYIVFEVNVDNTSGDPADTVDLSLLLYYKGSGETSNKTQTVEVATTVGQSAQYKQFVAEFTIDHDLVSNVIDIDDIISFRLNLETDTSEVDNIIINFITIRYQTPKPRITIN